MRTYELVLVLQPALTDAQRKKLLDGLKEWIKPATLAKENALGVKPLAYKIKQQTSGYYTVLHLEAESGLEKGFEKRLITNEDVLRHLLIRKR